MTDNDELSQLWQTQHVDEIDLKKVEAAFKKQKWRQRLYVVADIVALLLMFGAIFYIRSSFSTAAFVMLLVVGGLFIPTTAYLTWLRRHAAFPAVTDTVDFNASLKKQIRNNIRIAWFTKHSFWCVFLLLSGFYIVLYLMGEYGESKIWKLLFLMSGMAVFCIVGYIWAWRRERRFTRELTQFSEIFRRQ